MSAIVRLVTYDKSIVEGGIDTGNTEHELVGLEVLGGVGDDLLDLCRGFSLSLASLWVISSKIAFITLVSWLCTKHCMRKNATTSNTTTRMGWPMFPSQSQL